MLNDHEKSAEVQQHLREFKQMLNNPGSEHVANEQQADVSANLLQSEEAYVEYVKMDAFKLEELTEKRLHNQNLKQDRELRKDYAGKVFLLTCAWSVAIFAVVILQGFSVIHLSETVVVTLITSTTVNFFSFFLLVMKYLFQTKHPEPKN